MTQSLPKEYFDALYAGNADPWNFAGSDYEREKYAATIRALAGRRFASGLEIGCSIGILTRQLAALCDQLIALDIAAEPLALAARNCAGLHHVTLRQMSVPQAWPEGRFDLTMMSEVLYYLSPDDIAAAAAQAMRSRAQHGIIVLVHWLGETNYPCTADEATALFIQHSGLQPTHAFRTDCYRLDVLG